VVIAVLPEDGDVLLPVKEATLSTVDVGANPIISLALIARERTLGWVQVIVEPFGKKATL
jgi:hypothetical protein